MENERLDFVNDSLSLLQKTDGLTFGTDALLLAKYTTGRALSGAELGSGSGIISLLMLHSGKLKDALALEIQEEYAALTEKNARDNGLSDRLSVRCCDVREVEALASFDIVYTNPPYMTASSGYSNALDKKNIARHEVFGTISDFCFAAARLLKFGSRFYAVYRPDRLADLIHAMKEAKLEPKRATLVFADCNSTPSMILVEGRLGGGVGLKMTPPFFIYKDATHTEYSDDMKYVMENDGFPKKFLPR